VGIFRQTLTTLDIGRAASHAPATTRELTFSPTPSALDESFSFADQLRHRNDQAAAVQGSIVQSAVSWVAQNLGTARLRVVEVGRDGKEVEVDHEAVDLLRQPNSLMTWSALLQCIAASWICKGTAYILKRRSDSVYPPVESLEYLAPGTARPMIPRDGSAQIDGYEVYRNGSWIKVLEDDMIVLRYGFDSKTREGVNRLLPLLIGLFSDRKAAEHAAKMLSNGFIPPVLVAVGDKTNAPTPEQVNTIQRALDARMRGGKSNALAVGGNIEAQVSPLAHAALAHTTV
jgi:phage portal protein BeeE